LKKEERDSAGVTGADFPMFVDYGSMYMMQGKKAKILIDVLHEKKLLDLSINFK